MIIINLSPESELSNYEFLGLLNPKYYLASSGDKCNQNLNENMQNGLEITVTIIDPSIYCNLDHGEHIDKKETI